MGLNSAYNNCGKCFDKRAGGYCSNAYGRHSYLQEEEPTNVNPTTLWFAIDSEVNFSGGGVAIQNAETSDTPPETNIWFEPIYMV